MGLYCPEILNMDRESAIEWHDANLDLARSRLSEMNFPKSPLVERLQIMRVKTSVRTRQRATGW
jgi:hypothetical protein